MYLVDTEIRDSHLQGFLKKAIHHSKYHYSLRLLANCCTYGDKRLGVHLLSNGTHSKVLGVRPCKHSWACPYCTARKMSKYASKIASAIDAIAAVEDKVPIMITFTFFHTKEYSAGDCFDIITQAYTLLDKAGTLKNKKVINGKEYLNTGVWGKFLNEFQIKHKIKAVEATYGEHGWHVHYHNLYFVPRNRLKDVLQFEESLQKRWHDCINSTVKKLFPDRYESYLYLSNKYFNNPDNENLGLLISRNSDGSVRAVDSAFYSCGFSNSEKNATRSYWDLSCELTKTHLKNAAVGHYTPYQLLCKAYEGDQKALDAYLEFAYAAINRKQHRVDFSRTGIKAIIQNWRNSQGYKEYIKKKNTTILRDLHIAPFRTVCWFTAEQWQLICNESLYYPWLIPMIRSFSLSDDLDFSYSLICELLSVFAIPVPRRFPPIDLSVPFNSLIRGDIPPEEFKESVCGAPKLVPFDIQAYFSA